MPFLKRMFLWKQRVIIYGISLAIAGIIYGLLRQSYDQGEIGLLELVAGTALAFVGVRTLLHFIVNQLWSAGSNLLTRGFNSKSDGKQD